MKLYAFSCLNRAVTAKKCTKKRDTRALLLFSFVLPIQLIAFLTFSLSSPSWHLKVPNENATAVTKVRADLKTSLTNGKIFETRLGGKICAFDVNIHEGYSSL